MQTLIKNLEVLNGGTISVVAGFVTVCLDICLRQVCRTITKTSDTFENIVEQHRDWRRTSLAQKLR